MEFQIIVENTGKSTNVIDTKSDYSFKEIKENKFGGRGRQVWTEGWEGGRI